MPILDSPLFPPPRGVTLDAIRSDRRSRFSNRRLMCFIDACLGSAGAAVATVVFKNSELAGAEPFTREVETIDRQTAAQDLADGRGRPGHAPWKTEIAP